MKNFFSSLSRVWKSEDIRRKLVFTILILTLYRLAANVPAPGVDFNVLAAFRASTASGGNFLDFFYFLSGGTVSNFSLLFLRVYPLITSQLIFLLFFPII